jgi:hypothetical protein
MIPFIKCLKEIDILILLRLNSKYIPKKLFLPSYVAIYLQRRHEPTIFKPSSLQLALGCRLGASSNADRLACPHDAPPCVPLADMLRRSSQWPPGGSRPVREGERGPNTRRWRWPDGLNEARAGPLVHRWLEGQRGNRETRAIGISSWQFTGRSCSCSTAHTPRRRRTRTARSHSSDESTTRWGPAPASKPRRPTTQ